MPKRWLAPRQAGRRVIAAVCLVEREEARSRAAFEATRHAGATTSEDEPPFLALYTANHMKAAHVRQLSPA
jgi:orotate phosphoribosyltransferase